MSYQNNEKVVITESLKMGTVTQVDESNKKVQIQLSDGTTIWHNYADVKKMLIETEPDNTKTKLW
tara:strand:- start:564 stop:758 length:195 start_codon:yes stop_codon:yes gene_type:complete